MVGLHVGGLISRTQTHVRWLQRALKQGDSVRIEVADVTKVDRPRKRKAESARSRRKREQEYVVKKAAEWGWKIVK